MDVKEAEILLSFFRRVFDRSEDGKTFYKGNQIVCNIHIDGDNCKFYLRHNPEMEEKGNDGYNFIDNFDEIIGTYFPYYTNKEK